MSGLMPPKHRKIIPTSLVILSMCYTTFLLLVYLFADKELYSPFHTLAADGMLVAPIALMLMDVIVEVFGYQVGKQVFWSSLVVQAMFCVVGFVLAYLPDPGFPFPDVISANHYRLIFGTLPTTFVSCFLGMVTGTWLNARLISKWKFMLHGRYFWIRCIGASAIGDGLFLVVPTFIDHLGNYPFLSLLNAILGVYLFELSAILILSPLSVLLAAFLKYLLSDYLAENPALQFNPFSKKGKGSKNQPLF